MASEQEPHKVRSESGPSNAAVQDALEKILRSDAFRQSGRVSQLLHFIVELSLAGESDRLKESVIGVEVFDRTPGYDLKSDPIVRVTAGRLRNKLEEYYSSEGRVDPLRIEFLRGSYIPTFIPRTEEIAAPPPAILSGRGRLLAIAAAVLLGAFVPISTTWRFFHARGAIPATLTRLTFDEGQDVDPTLSPDGRLLAFASDRSGEGNFDIWVQQVGGKEPVRLTRHPANDYNPQFSPDGTQIAFRSDREGGGLYAIPALGGGERLIALKGNRPRFSPDGKWIAYSVHIDDAYVVPARGGAPRQVRLPCCRIVTFPIWVGAGRLLVFARPDGENDSDSDLWVTSLEGGLAIRTGVASLVAQHGLSGVNGSRIIPGFWSAERRTIVFSAIYGDSTDLWEVALSPDTWRASGTPRRVTFLTSGSSLDLAPSPGPDGRIAFMSAISEIGVWSGGINSEPGSTRRPLERVRQGAWGPSVTPDGTAMVFNKLEHSGNWDVWLKDLSDGAETPVAVTKAPEVWPKISPDGQKVAYAVRPVPQIRVWSRRRPEPEAVCDHCREPWTWSSNGRYLLVRPGESHQIAAIEFGASTDMTIVYESAGFKLEGSRFSPDDRWVAFAVHKGEVAEVFVAPFRGRAPVSRREWMQITAEDVFTQVVGWSPDGRTLYYLSDRDGFRCFWAQRMEAVTKRPTGPPVEVFPIHRPFARPVLKPGAFEAALAHDRFFFSMGEMRGDIWMLTPR